MADTMAWRQASGSLPPVGAMPISRHRAVHIASLTERRHDHVSPGRYAEAFPPARVVDTATLVRPLSNPP
jgi:hypothetical protein